MWLRPFLPLLLALLGAPTLRAEPATATGTQAEPLPASEPRAAEPLALEAALLEAAAHAPALAEARARQAAAHSEVGAAGALAPSTASVGAGFNDPRWSVGLAQRFSAFGARSARVAAAEAGARGAEAEARAGAAGVRAEARRAYFALVRAEAQLSAAERALQLARSGEEAAQARFDTGAAPELDLIQARLTRANAEAERETQEGERSARSAELAGLLGRDPARPLQPVGSAPPPPLPALAAVLARAATAPQALAGQAQVEVADAQLRAAQRERWPAPTVGVSVEAEGPPGEQRRYLRGGLELELPLLGLNGAEVRRAEATLRLAQAQAEADARRRRPAVVAAHLRLEAALRALAHYPKEILPAAERVEQMALEAYRAGQAPLSALNDARRASAETRDRAAEAAWAAQAAFADLELAAGVPLDAP
ncbi:MULTISPECIES: TolC family protein [Myxococcaceae]|uniref:TolC family protein n=1 Tax=Myxococcaceae TaxID=31 RepID=UPI00189006FB|nr:TolC family protein [Simulacricoccus sp. 17bor-14]